MTKTSWKVKVILFRCEMTKTQLDPRSSIRACLCTEDFCNHDEQGGELFGEILYSCTLLHISGHKMTPVLHETARYINMCSTIIEIDAS